ncbi:MAG TPA: Uma2 family endonuclease [Saprospiraceae bacterium]|nr:Uma2 family endonuclease [Saprospiraceae bacterium]HMQ84524.1 Uma2 family endonuclease [Saprospiraceae bacterium]
MNLNAVSADLLKRPDLPLVIEQVRHQLEGEAKRREKFRDWLGEDQKAEYINGEIIMHTPVKRNHLRVSENLTTLLGIHIRLHQQGIIMVEKALIGLTRNDYEPDICYFTKERAAVFTDDRVVFPAPDFVVEIVSKKTSKIDRGIKHTDYASHGVIEYWIIDPARKTLEQFVRVGNDTEFMPASKLLIGQIVSSVVIAGFDIPVAALFEEDACLEALKKMIQPDSTGKL